MTETPAPAPSESPAPRLVGNDELDWREGTGLAADLRRIVAAADQEDRATNLNEAACLQLKHRGLAGAQLHLDGATPPGGFSLLYDGTLDLVVEPGSRGHGLGTALASASLATVESEVDAWSHSDHPAAAKIAHRIGLHRDRELWVMRRPLQDPADTLVPAEPPADYRVRTFRPGDEKGLLETNALAFSHHPEQGHMSLEDFRERQDEAWFDPAGLFLAVAPDASGEGTRVLGFHWTKVHPSETGDADDRVGEVYVVAVDPRAAGRGIGSVLTNAGLRHLRDLGLSEVILYVDGDNDPAIAVYTSAGFERIRVEAQYRGHPTL